ncbi:MAG: HD domain-containing protein [Verrucomicrobiales bacterium]|nr:hypothetical protein [Verrucomicrobiota bacterium JB025]
MKLATTRRFQDLCGRAGVADAVSAAVIQELMTLYSDGPRSYHNLSRIERMLGEHDACGGGPDAVEMAIWFHDAIHVPMDKLNAANSARYFTDRMGPVMEGAEIDRVVRLIFATDPASPRSGMEDEDLLIDIDRSILGAPAADYEVYRQAVRNEYAAVGDDEFAAGRRALLEGFLEEPIYATEYFSRLERQARTNISGELAALGAGGCLVG